MAEIESWTVWNSYNYSETEHFKTEEEALKRFEEVCNNDWVSSAFLNKVILMKEYHKRNETGHD